MSEIERRRNAAWVQPHGSVPTVKCAKACFFFFIASHKKKESPICLAAGELNESFYGLSNLGE